MREGEIIGRYLLKGKFPGERAIDLYEKALMYQPISFTPKEEKIWSFIVRNPFLIGAIDSALGFSRKNQNIRRRILYMSAILETQPEHASLFLPQERQFFYNLYIFWVGCRAVFKMFIGKTLLLFL
jgi:hypothetical protein